MERHTLSAGELTQVVRACRAIRLSSSTPNYLQEFLVRKLAAGYPDLSAKVAQLNQVQMDDLCAMIQSRQQQENEDAR